MFEQQTHKVVDSPPYADFPRAEYERRLTRMRELMEAGGVDLLALWSAPNIRYFTGYQSLHWGSLSLQPAVVLLPLDHEPVIIVPDFFSGVVEGYTYVNDIRLDVLPHLTVNLRQLPARVAGLIEQLGYSKRRIGLETGHLGMMTIPRPLNDIDLFRASLGDATFVDAGDLIWECRVVKSPCEVEAIREATTAVVRAYGDVLGGFELGMSERDVGRLLQTSILKYTEVCEPPIATASSRLVVMPDTPSFYDEVGLSPRDRIAMEPLPTYKGYCGSCARVFQVGELDDEALRKAETVDAAQDAAIAALRPGVKAKELVEIIGEVMRSGGLEPVGDEMAGHGVGLDTQEPPMIAVGEEGEIREGMVMAVEVWAVDWYSTSAHTNIMGDVFGVEDLLVVTRDGCDRLPSLPRNIRSLTQGH